MFFMSKRKRATVQILNSPHGRGYTSLKSANDEVRRGAAEFRDGGLWLLDGTPRAAFIRDAVAGSSQANYDQASREGIASLDSIRHLPVVGDVVKLFTKQTGRKAPRGKSGPVTYPLLGNGAAA